MRVSVIDRLRVLPPVFNLSHVAHVLDLNIEISRDLNKMHVYLDRWKKKTLIESAGPRSGIYYNLLKKPDAAKEMQGDALLMLYPSAVVCGVSVLHAAGWTTQIPSKTEVAVLKRPSYARLYEFEIQGKSRDWYVQFKNFVVRDADWSIGGLPSLTPEAALVDLAIRGGGLDEDDLDIPDESISKIVTVCHEAGVQIPKSLAWRMENSMGL